MESKLASLPVAAGIMLFVSVVILIAVEMVIDRCRRRRVDMRDSVNSMTIGLGYLAVKAVAGKALELAAFLWVYEHCRLFTLDIHNPLHWLAAWMLADFAYYWIHRAEHRVRVLWCSHLVHHSSKEFSFTTAVRMPWTDVFYRALTGLWAPLLGVHPGMAALIGALRLMTGQLQHTKLVGKLGMLDKVFSTPSNHRVHHASNAQYLDRNFGGTIMLWDRLFGTYCAETVTPVYGLTKDLTATTPFAIAAGGYPDLFRAVRATAGKRDRVRLCLGRPA